MQKIKKQMGTNETERKGCSRKPVVVFLLFAVIIVAAFLIIGLVRTCSDEHEQKEEAAIENNIGGLLTPQDTKSL